MGIKTPRGGAKTVGDGGALCLLSGCLCMCVCMWYLLCKLYYIDIVFKSVRPPSIRQNDCAPLLQWQQGALLKSEEEGGD